MILGVSAIGAIVVLVLQYRIFRIENIEQGNKENKKSAARIAKEKKNSLFDFLTSADFSKAVIDLLVIILGSTIAINITDLHEKKQTKEQVVQLLDLARKQAENNIELNEETLQLFKELRVEIGELKDSVAYEVSMTELVIENNDVVITLTPVTISTLTSAINGINDACKKIEETDDPNEILNIYIPIINDQLTIMKEAARIEIDYLEGRCSKKEVGERYGELFEDMPYTIHHTK
jgi:hypothetical protein